MCQIDHLWAGKSFSPGSRKRLFSSSGKFSLSDRNSLSSSVKPERIRTSSLGAEGAILAPRSLPFFLICSQEIGLATFCRWLLLEAWLYREIRGDAVQRMDRTRRRPTG